MKFSQNILPYDGEVIYLSNFLTEEKANDYFNYFLNNINWKPDEVILFGKKIITKRKVAWYAHKKISYTYSNVTKQASLFTPEIIQLKNLVEKETGSLFNSCLFNLYHNGEEGMGWHSDDEKELKKNGVIASISLGSARKFIFKHIITKEKIEIILEDGSLLLMKGFVQQYWLHALPKSKKTTLPRINLTFRTMN